MSMYLDNDPHLAIAALSPEPVSAGILEISENDLNSVSGGSCFKYVLKQTEKGYVWSIEDTCPPVPVHATTR